jgi:type IV secretory pathway VirB10-like protein
MPSRSSVVHIPALVLACALAFGAGGCAHNKVRASVPVTASPLEPSPETVRPMTTAPDTDARPPVDAEATPPAISPGAGPPAPVLIEPATPPAPRRRAEERPAQADEQPAEHPAPQISPQISPTDQSVYARKTADDIATAVHNLEQTAGKHLSAAQQDLADKIRSFVAQSRDASKGGDWDRAQNLAQKARLLSNELLNSL